MIPINKNTELGSRLFFTKVGLLSSYGLVLNLGAFAEMCFCREGEEGEAIWNPMVSTGGKHPPTRGNTDDLFETKPLCLFALLIMQIV